MGLVEIHPARGFAGADKPLRTLQLFERIERRKDERVDSHAYLRAARGTAGEPL